jgi:hypothetical protein
MLNFKVNLHDLGDFDRVSKCFTYARIVHTSTIDIAKSARKKYQLLSKTSLHIINSINSEKI